MKYFVDSNGKYIGGFSDGNPAIPQGVIEVPNPPSNISERWNFNIEKWAQDTEIKKQLLKNQLILLRKSYLTKTDWLRIKELDMPEKPCPEQIKNKRIQAWQQIDDINAATTLTALNEFSIDFE